MILGDNTRLDYVLRGVPSHPNVGVDVAIVNALGNDHIAAAAHAPGAAATAYEARKRHKYQARCDRSGVHFVPFIVDTLGALGASAQEHIKVLGKAWAQTQGVGTTSAMHYVRHRVGVAIAAGIADAFLRQEGICRTVASAGGAPPPEVAVDRPLL